MKCPQCAAWTIVEATRAGIKRTRVCANQHRFHTEEVVVGAAEGVAKPRLSGHHLAERNAAIRADTRRHWVIAQAYGLSVSRIRFIKREQ